MRNRPNIETLTKDTITLATTGLRDARDPATQQYYYGYSVDAFITFARQAGVVDEYEELLEVEQDIVPKSEKFPFLSHYITPETEIDKHFSTSEEDAEEVRSFREYVERIVE